MLSVPDRLLNLDSVSVLLKQPGAVILSKSLKKSLEGRESYVAMHALSMVVRGEQIIRSEQGQVLELRNGSIGVLPRGLYTITDLVDEGDGFESLLIFLSEEKLQELIAGDHWPQPTEGENHFRVWNRSALIDSWRQSVLDLHQHLGTASSEILEVKLQEFFRILAAESPERISELTRLGLPQSKSIREFMESHFDKALTIQDYAYLTGRSESAFRREFKTKYGVPPLTWIKLKRLEKAQELLHSTQDQISEISNSVGYENVSHFISEFKKQFGTTPGRQR